MYVTRRLLRSTLEEVKGTGSPPSDADQAAIPRKRRPLAQSTTSGSVNDAVRVQNGASKAKKISVAVEAKIKVESAVKQTENEGDKRNKKGEKKQEGPILGGMGLLIDARDSRERWCEAKILDLNPSEKSVYIHYVGWNTRYDSWLPAKCLAAHGSHTGAKTKAGMSWNGKASLFTDPAKPSVGVGVGAPASKPTKSKKSKPATQEEPTTLAPTPTSKAKKRPSDIVKEEKGDGEADTEASGGKGKPLKKLRTNAGEALEIQVAVDAVDEESERKSRRSRKSTVDLELDMDMNVKEEESRASTVGKKTPTKHTRSSPTAQVKAKSPKAATPKRKPSPRNVKDKAKTEVDDIALLKAMPSTVGMPAIRRSARAAVVGRSSAGKKRKKEEDDSDEEFVMDEDAEEEEEEDDEEEEEEEEEDDEALEDSDDERPRRSRGSNGKVRRAPSSSTARSGGSVASQWQTDPAYLATREKLASIFRNRLLQRGEFGAATFHGSFQDAMSGSSAASTPRSAAAGHAASTERSPAQGVAKHQKTKTQRTAATEDGSDAEEKAVDESVAAYYYMQHYYHMQAYQYHQYMYHQAMMAHQLHQQPATEGAEESKTEGSEDGDAGATQPQDGIMSGGIIDPRVIHARMDALEQRRAHQQLYLQHYNQTTERNLQMLASTPEFLQNGTQMWREQVANDHEPPRGSDEEQKEDTKDASEPSEEETKDVNDENEENQGSPATESTAKDDEAREAEGIRPQKDQAEETRSTVATPEPADPCHQEEPLREQTPPASVGSSPKQQNLSPEPSRSSPVKKEDKLATSSPAPGSAPPAQTEAVLFELAL